MTARGPDALGPANFLRLVGVAVALSVSVLAFEPSVSAAVGIGLAIVLFALAEVCDPAPAPAILPALPIEWPLPVRFALAVAIALCLVSAAAVAGDGSPTAQHLPWGLALLVFGAAAAAMTAPPARRLRRADLAALAVLAVACGGLFFFHLTSIPPEVHGDEAETALDALRLIEESGRGLFSTGWFALPTLHAAPTALGFLLFGPDLLGLRLTSAILATASVFLLFAIVRRLAGTPLAFTAAAILASQRYFVHLGRAGYHYIDTPFLSLLALWLMIRLWQDRRASSAIWCGVALGLGVQSYYASRLVPVLVALTTVFVAARAPRGQRGRYLAELALIALIALAVAAPLIAHFAGHLDELWGRTRETSIFSPESREHLFYTHGTRSLSTLLGIQFRQALSIFHFVGDNSVQYGYGAPLLDLASGVLFVAGLGTMLARLAQPLAFVALLWIALPLTIGGALTIDTPFFPRIGGIVPFVAMVCAVGTRQVAEIFAAAFAEPTRRARTIAALTAVILGAVVILNTASYFGHYAPNYRHSPMREIAEWIRDQGRGNKTYLFDQRDRFSIDHGTISFLAGSFARQDVDDVESFFAQDTVDPRRSRFVVMAGSEDLLPRLQAKFGPLDITPHPDVRGKIRFHTATPAGVSGYGLEARAAAVNKARARPWLILMAVLAATAAVAAWRQRRSAQGARAAAASGADRHSGARPELDEGRVADLSTPLSGGEFPGEPALGGIAGLSRPVVIASLVLIVLLAAGLRLARLEQLPAGFYCDEAGNVYNAASILRTGRDETGALFPLYIWSFDTSYKNPVFIYAATIPVALFGPGPFAARVTAAAFGIAAVVAIFFLGRAMLGPVVGLFAALFLAVIPWHLHFSRIAFELISFPTLFLIGAVGLVRFANGRRSLPWAAGALGSSLYTYVPAKMFVPLFLAGFALVFRNQLWRRRRETVIAAVILAAVAAPLVVFDLSNQSRSSRYLLDTTFVTAETGLLDGAAQLIENCSHFFAPTFLFASGDPVPRHAVTGHGELYPVLAPLLLIGVLAIVRSRSPSATLVLLWLALYPLAAAFIKREIPSASRSIIGAPAFCLLAAIGADWIWQHIAMLGRPRLRSGVIRAVALAGFAIILAAQTVRYWNLYSETYPLYSAKHFTGFQYGHEQVVDYFLEHYDEYDRFLLTTNLSNQPEIFLRLFAGLKQPPSDAAPPFEMPAKIDRGTPPELHLYRGDRLLFAVVPKDLLYFADYEILEKIVAPDGSIAFLIVEVREAKDFVYTWMAAGPYPATATPPLPEYDPAAPPRTAAGGREWRRYQQRRAPVLLDLLYGEETDDSCAWAINFAFVPSDRRVRVYAGFDDAGEIWVNGARVELQGEDNPFQTWVDTSFGSLDLRAGRNSIAVKTCDIGGGWIFYFRLAGEDGLRVPGLQWEYVFEEGL